MSMFAVPSIVQNGVVYMDALALAKWIENTTGLEEATSDETLKVLALTLNDLVVQVTEALASVKARTFNEPDVLKA